MRVDCQFLIHLQAGEFGSCFVTESTVSMKDPEIGQATCQSVSFEWGNHSRAVRYKPNVRHESQVSDEKKIMQATEFIIYFETTEELKLHSVPPFCKVDIGKSVKKTKTKLSKREVNTVKIMILIFSNLMPIHPI